MEQKILPYSQSLSLFTDLYQLTMGYGYWKLGRDNEEAVFTMTIRKNPFEGGYTICAGLDPLIEALKEFRFYDDDIEYLRSLTGVGDTPLFSEEYLEYLRTLRMSCDIDAVPEGTVVFPHEPLVRVKGPMLQCQIIETLLLNLINYQSLIATKASRICIAADGEPVLEFGARRAQGIDGGLSASRASYIGGCAATSNLLAGKLYDIPVKGTHAHSWVMSFDDELEAFQQYAECMPNNCVFLVDTFNTINGIEKAIAVALAMKERGHHPVGIRLDSGDLAYLSIKAREMLDEAGLQEMSIVGSNDLDEFIIRSMKGQGAKINVWGVGTNLVTASGQPALGGVYKITAIQKQGVWEHKIKISEQSIKINTPGILQIRRFYDEDNVAVADMIHDELEPVKEHSLTIIDPKDPLRFRKVNHNHTCQDLLRPIFRKGELVYQSPNLHEIKRYAQDQLASFHSGIKRFVNPHSYPAGIEEQLFNKKASLIKKLRSDGLQKR